MRERSNCANCFRIGEDGGRSAAAELAALTQPLQSRHKLATEDFPQDRAR